VERAQKTVIDEFYAIADLDDPELSLCLAEWQHFYNWYRKHGSIGTTPMEKLGHRYSATPYWDDVEKMFEPDKELDIDEKNLNNNRDRGTGNRPPPTPPGMRVRTRRFGQV